MIKYLYRRQNINKLQMHKSPRPGCWIDIENATAKDIEYVSNLLGLETADIVDSLDPYETPRLEKENDCTLIFLQIPETSQNDLNTSTLTIIISPNYFITITISKSTLIQKVVGSLQKGNHELATSHRSKLLIFVFKSLAAAFTRKIKEVRNQVHENRLAISEVNTAAIAKLSDNEEILNQYLSALKPTQTIFQNLMKGKHISLYENDLDLLEDALIAINQSSDICSVNLKSVQNLRDYYQIIFSNRLNKTMYMLTIATITMTIPTIVASIFGMNVNIPLSNTPHIFEFIIVFSAILCLCVILLIRKIR